MSLAAKIKGRLESLGVQPKKSLGQNFLVNESVVSKILNLVRDLDCAKIIEVGPGAGSLTDELVQLQKPLVVIELDRTYAEFWRKEGVEVVEGDALKVNWNQLASETDTLFISNLPYQISSRICIDRTEGPEEVQKMVLMFQKEVAQKIMSKPKGADYGFLSVVLQTFWKIENILEAGPGDFLPAPKVASRVLFFRRQKQEGIEIKKYIGFVKVAFHQRRKMMVKNLMAQYQKSDIQTAMETCRIGEKVRAEELSPQQFVALFQNLSGVRT